MCTVCFLHVSGVLVFVRYQKKKGLPTGPEEELVEVRVSLLLSLSTAHPSSH